MEGNWLDLFLQTPYHQHQTTYLYIFGIIEAQEHSPFWIMILLQGTGNSSPWTQWTQVLVSAVKSGFHSVAGQPIYFLFSHVLLKCIWLLGEQYPITWCLLFSLFSLQCVCVCVCVNFSIVGDRKGSRVLYSINFWLCPIVLTYRLLHKTVKGCSHKVVLSYFYMFWSDVQNIWLYLECVQWTICGVCNSSQQSRLWSIWHGLDRYSWFTTFHSTEFLF